MKRKRESVIHRLCWSLKILACSRIRLVFIAVATILALGVLVFAAFFQSFETDEAGWFGAMRVMSGNQGVTSKTGAFHAKDTGGAFTRWGGYSKTFPVGGYTTSIDIYLDIAAPYMTGSAYPNDTRFDWTSAISTPGCDHRRDFVFNAGFYTDSDTTGTGPRFVMSASNNAGRGSSFPKNPGRMPYTVTAEGWYTFEHRFRDDGAGVLAVDLTLKNSVGVPLMMWTLTDPLDVIDSTVGGNRYGWFPTDEFPTGLAFDNSALIGFQDFCTPPPSTAGAKVTGGGWIDVTGGTATFGLTAQVKDAMPSGNVTYQDHALNRTVKSATITAVVVNGNCAQIVGTATVNGTGMFGFEVTVCDNGEPGKDTDTFTINISDGYNAGGTLRGGNIQIH